MSYKCNIDITKALDWQRSNAPFITQYITEKQNWYNVNHCDFWENWVVNVFDLRTANDFGLNVWSIILNERLFGTTEASPKDWPGWAFGEFKKNFSRGNFGKNADGSFNFTTEQKRLVLRLKAFSLHMSGSVVQINNFLKVLFGDSKLLYFDNFDMSFNVVLNDNTQESFVRTLIELDVLPRPAGINLNLVVI